jgi:hypothetical protein
MGLTLLIIASCLAGAWLALSVFLGVEELITTHFEARGASHDPLHLAHQPEHRRARRLALRVPHLHLTHHA